ncbi:hypothetical protein OO184_15140 [Photorhabdus sp. APURE]|uniref:hypothetical protein n=1 Tax=Photorhabdus aballayi TaxID=2991723 RepID=UPI00223DD3BB|nr:hypothetical protein [Photorhabdus aballayi]MCW7549232.1 hypothetical protein [Photorhabdus aballayi]
MTKHVHAELMLQYAQDAFKTDEPWKMWEIKKPGMAWASLIRNPSWVQFCQYRRKSEMITIGKVSFPKPIDYELKNGDGYFTMTTLDNVNTFTWCSDNVDYYYLRSGLIHLTEESAKQHRDALIKINNGEF